VAAGLWLLYPILLNIKDQLLGPNTADKDALRKKRDRMFQESEEEDGIEGEGGSSGNRGGQTPISSGATLRLSGTIDSSQLTSNQEFISLTQTYCENLKSIGLELIAEDPQLTSLQSMVFILDNAILKNYWKILVKSDKLQNSILKFKQGANLMEMSGFRLEGGGNSDGSQANGESGSPSIVNDPNLDVKSKIAMIKAKIGTQQSYVFSPENKLQAQVARTCLQFVLDVSKACGGNRRWQTLDPKCLIPDDCL